MATLRRNPRGTYYVDYRWRGCRFRKSLYTRDQAEAEARFATFTADILPGLRPRACARTIEDIRRAYLGGHLAGHPHNSRKSARTALNVTKNQLCVGLLFFPVKGGIQPGNWKMIVDFEETRAEVPFTLEVKE